jgi:hypothetical protein
MQYAQGDLKLIINELDIDVLTAEDSGEQVLRHIQESFLECTDKSMPKALQRALFAHEGKRGRGETLLHYTARKRTLFAESR